MRNYRVSGECVPTTLQVGASLYDGWNPAATGASDMQFVPAYYRAQKREDAAAGRTQRGFEARLDRRLQADAVAWARTHLSDVIRLAGHKFVRLWNVWPNASEFRSWPLRVVVATGYIPLFVLGWIGLARRERRMWPATLCVLPAAYVTCLHLVFVSSIRYRDPAMLVWSILAAAAVTDWWLRRVARRRVGSDSSVAAAGVK